MFAKANEEVGPVDILVNNAGITRVMISISERVSITCLRTC